MGIATISFKTPSPTDGIGPVNEGVDLPNMRGMKNCSDAKLIEILRGVAENLANANCTFWACRGPRRPQPMVTCGKCWALRDVMRVVRTLERRTEKQS